MIDFSTKTKENLLEEMLERVDEEIDKRDLSILHTALAPAAWELEGLYLHLAQVQENAFIETAVGEYLDKKVLERNIYRKSAVRAVRKGEFDVAVPIGSVFSTINGVDSVNFAVVSLISEGNSSYCYRLECDTEGIAGNGYRGDLLPVSYVSGLNQAILTDILLPGTEEETDDSLRARYMESLTEKSFGGNLAAYRREILSIEGVGAVQVYPAYQGGGTVLCSILDSNYNIAASNLLNKVQMIICPPEEGEGEPSTNGYGMAPIGAKVVIVSAKEKQIDITATVQTQQEFNFSMINKSIQEAIGNYFEETKREWGKQMDGYQVRYSSIIYLARVIFAALSVPGVVNVADVKMNGKAEDIVCKEDCEIQELPVLGVITLVRS